MAELCWYGSGAVQPWMLLGALVLFPLAVVALPSGWLVHKLSRGEPRPAAARQTAWLAALFGLGATAVVAGLNYVLLEITLASPRPIYGQLPTAWNVLVGGTWLSLVLGGLQVRGVEGLGGPPASVAGAGVLWANFDGRGAVGAVCLLLGPAAAGTLVCFFAAIRMENR